MDKIYKIVLNSIPILVMVGLIPLISNDLVLMTAFGLVISGSFFIKIERKEWIVFGGAFIDDIF